MGAKSIQVIPVSMSCVFFCVCGLDSERKEGGVKFQDTHFKKNNKKPVKLWNVLFCVCVCSFRPGP